MALTEMGLWSFRRSFALYNRFSADNEYPRSLRSALRSALLHRKCSGFIQASHLYDSSGSAS